MARPLRTTGAPLSFTQTVITVPADTNTVLVKENQLRRYLAIVNIDAGDAWLGFNGPAEANAGWPMMGASALGRQGGGMIWEEGAVPQGAVNVISTIGTTVVVLEA